MKDLMPVFVMNKPAASHGTATAANKTGAQASQTALFGGLMTGPTSSSRSFIDSLVSALQSIGAKADVAADSVQGGKSLPLAPSAADFSLLADTPASTEAPLLSDLPEQADMAAMAGPASATLTELIGVNKTLQAADSSNAKSVTTTQAFQSLHQTDAVSSPEAALARMQPGSMQSSQDFDGINRGQPVKTAATQQAGAGAQPELRNDTVVNETDLLFSSRMQQSALSQPAERAARKLHLETLLNTTQTMSNESSQASIARTPIVQAGVSADPLPATPAQSAMTEAFGKPEWGQGMGKQVLWMVNQNISRAEIRLNPANLGPLEVRIEMDSDQVNVAFTSRHADVRDAVEQALPRLREMLEEKGLSLSDTDVSQHSFAEQQHNAFAHDDGNSTGIGSSLSYPDDIDQHDAMSQPGKNGPDAGRVSGEGLVDYYI